MKTNNKCNVTAFENACVKASEYWEKQAYKYMQNEYCFKKASYYAGLYLEHHFN